MESLDKVNGKYTLSLWTQDDILCNVKGNWLNLIIASFNDNDISSKVDLYVEPHKLSYEKEPIHYYALDVRSEGLLPETFFLSQNYPNPFNPITKIDYGLSKENHVDLIIYNITGRQVKVLVNQIEAPGFKTIEWNGLDQNGMNSGTGIYFYRLTVGDETHTRKMIYMK